MVCLPIRGDNPQALAGGLSPVQVEKSVVQLIHTILMNAQYEIFHAKIYDF